MMVLKTAAVAALLLSPAVAFGAGVLGSSKDLADKCALFAGRAAQVYGSDTQAAALGGGYCAGFINGMIGGYSFGNHGQPTAAFCLPDGVGAEQIARMVVQRMDETPSQEHAPAMALVLGVLIGEWPCATPQ